MDIHPSAIVSKTARLGEGIEIGPYAVIEDDVTIGRGVKISAHAQVLKHTTIGDDCQIHMGAILGHRPQIRQKHSEEGRLIIGQKNIFREYVTVHRSSQNNSATIIGDDNYFMAFAHIAHDCQVGNHITVCNGALIAGHCLLQDHAFVSGNVTVHQFCRIGELAMIGGLARVAKDVPPYMLVKGDSCVWAVNSVGLRRGNLSPQTRREIKDAFRLLYKSGLNVTQALYQLQKQSSSHEIRHLIDFITQSRRGICTHKNPRFLEKFFWGQRLGRQIGLAAYRFFPIDKKGRTQHA